MSWTAELRFAARSLRKTPGFAAVAITTLAVGIGAAAALFSVIRGVLLEPLPFPASDRLVQVWQIGDEAQQMRWSAPNFLDLRERSRSVERLAAYYTFQFTVTGDGDAARVPGAAVSEDFFRALGVTPALGRGFLPDEFRDEASVVLVSHAYWRDELGGDPGAPGRTLRLGDATHTIVGVLPPRLAFPAETRLWVPTSIPSDASRTAHNWRAIGRLADTVSVDAARAETDAIAARLKALHGDGTWMAGATVVRLQDEIVGPVRLALLVLLGAAGLLLVIACANVANLLLARATTRRREFAVRLALGAGRGRVMRQLLAESAMLALAAGGLGVLLSVWAVDALLAFEPGRMPRVDTIRVDWMVLGFAVLISAAAALAVGLAAALRATRAELDEALTDGGRAAVGGAAARLRGALIAAQVGLTLVLLVGAGLLGRSFLRLITLDPGYRTETGIVIDVVLPRSEGDVADPLFVGTPNPRGATVLRDLLDRLAAMPGAGRAGAINSFPLTGGGANGMFLVLDRPDEVRDFEDWGRLAGRSERTGYAEYRIAAPGYFEAMGIPLVRGRLFDRRDDVASAHVAVISASLAQTRWPGEDPIGKLIQFGNMDGVLHPLTVVGVVGDVRDRSLEAPAQPTLYGNAFQRTTGLGTVQVVVAADPTTGGPASGGSGLIPAARDVVRELVPGAPVRFRTVDEIFSSSLSDRRFSLLLLGVFGATALFLATLGIYGVISYAVAQRTREIGIRMALGAQQRSVLRLIVREGLVLTLVGLVPGLAVAFLATRVLASQLYGIGTLDPLTFAAVALILMATAALASYGPARRATRVDPTEALRQE